jgi:hypothetical protein
MLNSAHKALKIAEEQINKINKIDGQLSTIYNTFSTKDTATKKSSLEEYISQMDARENEYGIVQDVQDYLLSVVKNLESLNLGRADYKAHKKRIAEMKRQIANAVEFVDDEEVLAVQEDIIVKPDLAVMQEVKDAKKQKS